jgi:hypothetical protein
VSEFVASVGKSNAGKSGIEESVEGNSGGNVFATGAAGAGAFSFFLNQSFHPIQPLSHRSGI